MYSAVELEIHSKIRVELHYNRFFVDYVEFRGTFSYDDAIRLSTSSKKFGAT